MPPPARRAFDERDDYDDVPRRPRSNPGLVVALVAGGAFALGCVVCAGIGLFGFWAAPVPVAQGPAGGPPAVQGEAGQTKAGAVERKRAAEEAEDDRAQADYPARHAALARGWDDQIAARYQQLTAAQREAVDDLRAAVTRRPAVELTPAQRTTLDARADFLRHTDVLAYRLALADQNDGRRLARLLKLSHDPAVLFRLAYGGELPDRRPRVRAAIERAAEKGRAALGDEEERVLQPYREHLRRLPP